MNYQLMFLSDLLKNLILPLTTLLMVISSIWIAWRKGLFTIKPKSISEDTERRILIQGEGNVVTIAPSEFQKLAYDVDKFSEYHQQSISQSRISFWFSLVFATVGFLIIATSIFTYSDKSGYLGIIAGTIIDAVSALFFFQSNKARQLMSDFFDKLRQDRKLEESLKLCDTVDDWFFRNALKVKLSLFFAGLEDSHNIASEIIRLGQGELESRRSRDASKMAPGKDVTSAQVNEEQNSRIDSSKDKE